MNCILLTFDRTYHYHTDERQSYLFSDIQKCDNNLQNFQTDFEWNVAIFNRGEINVTLKTLTCTLNDRITFWGKSGWTNWILCKFLNKQTANSSVLQQSWSVSSIRLALSHPYIYWLRTTQGVVHLFLDFQELPSLVPLIYNYSVYGAHLFSIVPRISVIYHKAEESFPGEGCHWLLQSHI